MNTHSFFLPGTFPVFFHAMGPVSVAQNLPGLQCLSAPLFEFSGSKKTKPEQVFCSGLSKWREEKEDYLSPTRLKPGSEPLQMGFVCLKMRNPLGTGLFDGMNEFFTGGATNPKFRSWWQMLC